MIDNSFMLESLVEIVASLHIEKFNGQVAVWPLFCQIYPPKVAKALHIYELFIIFFPAQTFYLRIT